eukprot:365522-Chlamydomonas_euryale.AAC.15
MDGHTDYVEIRDAVSNPVITPTLNPNLHERAVYLPWRTCGRHPWPTVSAVGAQVAHHVAAHRWVLALLGPTVVAYAVLRLQAKRTNPEPPFQKEAEHVPSGEAALEGERPSFERIAIARR